MEDIPDGTSCLANEENNSVWYTFTIDSSGVLAFSIAPLSGDDYDFALFNITDDGCAGIANGGLEVRCSNYFSNGPTGLGIGSDPSFDDTLHVFAWQVFALVVDNFSATQAGYSIDFTQSTARLRDTSAPSVTRVDSVVCMSANQVVVHMSEPVLCSSIMTNGSDFTISGPFAVNIMSAQGQACFQNTTSRITITLTQPMTVMGSYILTLSGNLEDQCGNVSNPASYSFYVPDCATSARPIESEFGFRIFPTLTNRNLFIETTKSRTGKVNVDIMDMPGQYVYRKSLQMDAQPYELDLSFLQEGAYLLRISDDRNSATQRFTFLR